MWWSFGHPDISDAVHWHAQRARELESAALVELYIHEALPGPVSATMLKAWRATCASHDEWAIAVTAMLTWVLADD
jgi:hypothetical protein